MKVSSAGANCNWPALPMPLSKTVCGELEALSATLSVAWNAPALCGQNCTVMVQLSLAGIDVLKLTYVSVQLPFG